MYCPRCGTWNDDSAVRCVACGHFLQPYAEHGPPAGESSPSQYQPPTYTPPRYQPPGPPPRVPTYLSTAILVTLFCCLPLGIPAIVYASQVNSRLSVGDYQGAIEASNKARRWCWIAFLAGLVGTILYIVGIVGTASMN